MKINELVSHIDGELINPSVVNENNIPIRGGCGADLMSDVLAYVQAGAVLFTGLCNPQVVRTAQMAEIAAIVFVRGKIPPKETILLADEENVPLITSPYGMFELCGRLFQLGLPSLEKPAKDIE